MNPCSCNNPPAPVTREGEEVCPACKRPPKKGEDFGKAGAQNDDRMSDDKKLALWMIKQHLRMIHEIRQRYGIQE